MLRSLSGRWSPRVLVLACSVVVLLSLAGAPAEAAKKNSSPARSGAEMTCAVPDWVNKAPSDAEFFYAVGVSGPTFFPVNAFRQAGQDARKNLAKVVMSVVVNELKNHGAIDSGKQQKIIDDMVYSFTHARLYGAEIVSYWVDCGGVMSKDKCSLFALARMPKGKQAAITTDIQQHYDLER